ncbi:hypothetical protein GCM10027286_07040 [Virgibacillus ainsalahensis]
MEMSDNTTIFKIESGNFKIKKYYSKGWDYNYASHRKDLGQRLCKQHRVGPWLKRCLQKTTARIGNQPSCYVVFYINCEG